MSAVVMEKKLPVRLRHFRRVPSMDWFLQKVFLQLYKLFSKAMSQMFLMKVFLVNLTPESLLCEENERLELDQYYLRHFFKHRCDDDLV